MDITWTLPAVLTAWLRGYPAPWRLAALPLPVEPPAAPVKPGLGPLTPRPAAALDDSQRALARAVTRVSHPRNGVSMTTRWTPLPPPSRSVIRCVRSPTSTTARTGDAR